MIIPQCAQRLWLLQRADDHFDARSDARRFMSAIALLLEGWTDVDVERPDGSPDAKSSSRSPYSTAVRP